MKRGLALLGLTAAGLGIGALGQRLTGHDAWYLALPLLLLAGWWRVADPTRCEPPERPERPGRAAPPASGEDRPSGS